MISRVSNLSENQELLREVACYEALWLEPGRWFKAVGEMVRSADGNRPSALVSAESMRTAYAALCSRLSGLSHPVGALCLWAESYPPHLSDARNAPPVLYCAGNVGLLEKPGIAVVGSRQPSAEGLSNATRIGRALARQGLVVYSGLARGIDRAAHEGALEEGGEVVAVIGTPLDESYPKENAKLQAEIASRHLLVSQVPFLRYREQNYRQNRLFFPERNATMSALSKATIVVEAGETSGTLIQARAAIAQGRGLAILESCFRNKELSWPERFLAAGARRVVSVSDVLRFAAEIIG